MTPEPLVSLDQQVADHEADAYRQSVARVAGYLRDLADGVERATAHDQPSIDGTPRFSAAARAVFHDLLWGFANLNADRLIDAAGRADAAEARLTASRNGEPS